MKELVFNFQYFLKPCRFGVKLLLFFGLFLLIIVIFPSLFYLSFAACLSSCSSSPVSFVLVLADAPWLLRWEELLGKQTWDTGAKAADARALQILDSVASPSFDHLRTDLHIQLYIYTTAKLHSCTSVQIRNYTTVELKSYTTVQVDIQI